MTQVKGSDVVSTGGVHAKCEKAYASVQKKTKPIDLDSTGSPNANLLLEFLTCQSKASKSCLDDKKAYELCHKSVMGVGSYQGNHHCGGQMKAFLDCVVTSND